MHRDAPSGSREGLHATPAEAVPTRRDGFPLPDQVRDKLRGNDIERACFRSNVSYIDGVPRSVRPGGRQLSQFMC